MTLPVSEIFPQLTNELEQHNKVILQAPPGAGKSTLLPLLLLQSGQYHSGKQIVMLEPRRVAARQIARYLAQQLGEKVGETVGIRMRGETKIGRDTALTIVTDGTMVRQIQNDPELSDVALVVFDEFHERALQADLALALALEAQELNEDLRLLIMSATLDIEKLQSELAAPIVASEGRQFPVDIKYVSSSVIPTVEEILGVVKTALIEQSSSVLVFLPGVAEIKRLEEQLSPYLDPQTDCFPLYGGLSLQQQSLAISPAEAGRRKVVLATNLAQTSLTIEGVDVVVDSGLERIVEHQFDTAMDKLTTQPVSISSAIQRAGRAGRLRPGVCYRLGAKESFERRRQHDVAEIERTDLSPLLLELAVWGSQFEDLFWLSRPSSTALNRAQQKLVNLGFLRVSEEQYKSTELTHWFAKHQLDLRTTKLFYELNELCLEPEQDWFSSAIELGSLLELNAKMTGDLNSVFSSLSRQDKTQFEQNKTKLSGIFKVDKKHHGEANLGVLLALAYPDRVAMKQGKRWKLANGSQASFPYNLVEPSSKFIVVASLTSSAKGVFVQSYLPLDGGAFKNELQSLVETKDHTFWSEQSQKPSKAKRTSIGSLVLESSPLPLELDDEQWQQVWLGYLQENGLAAIGWGSAEQIALSHRMEILRQEDNNFDWPDWQYEHLFETLSSWLRPYLVGVKSLKQLQQLNICELLCNGLEWSFQQRLEQLCPVKYVTPAGNKTSIDYTGEKVKIAVKLQEMFGEPQSPTICNGKVPITIELLSPARRPLQITQDLAHFWQNGYVDVKKEMKGRYPKHPWPDNPLEAIATNKTKRHLGQ